VKTSGGGDPVGGDLLIGAVAVTVSDRISARLRGELSIADPLGDQVQQHLADGEPVEVLAKELVPLQFAALRLAGGVGRNDHVPRPERVPLWQRLGVGHVQPCRGNLTTIQGGDQRRGVDHLGA
jgi:hypothetical protein